MTDSQKPEDNATPEQAARPPFNELSILFPLLTIYTVAYLGLMLADFLLRGAFNLPPGMMPVYIALVGAYAGDKEIRRWTRNEAPSRKGAIFVYLWLLFFLVAFMIFAFRPEFSLPDDLLKVALQVLGIFFGSRASKYVYETRTRGESPEVVSARQDAVLNLVREKGRVTGRDVADLFQISETSARRILSAMTEKGLIRKVGERKGAFYVQISLTGDER